MTKTFIWLGLIIGSTVGGFIPTLWGGDMLSGAGFGLSTVGALLGVLGGYKLGNFLG